MPAPLRKPRIVSPVAATALPATPRPVSIKRIGRMRMNWFVVGSAFGIGLSFFMQFVVTAVVLPGYDKLAHPKTHAPQLAQAPSARTYAPATPEAMTAAAPPPAVIAAPILAPESYPRTLALQIGRGDTLLELLLANRVQNTDAYNVISALKSARVNLRSLPVGQKISVTLARHESVGDKAAVRELAMKLPNFSTIELQRLQSGNFNVAATKEELKNSSYRGFGKVRTSLMQAAADGHIPAATVNEIVKAYSYDIDFQRDIHPGDTIEVLMERKTTSDGRIGGYGAARYAALTLKGKKYEIFRFKNSAGEFAWFDGNGNSVKKSLLRTPVNAAHITSGFGMRMHPLLGYTKMHRGVDFGAGTGTPIFAAGDGVVAFKGWKSGYGNFVLIKHNNTYETAYGHISKFGNISVGNRVRQGQVIAYVGMTGAATGPHLHYEVRQNDKQVNPAARQFNMATGLSAKQLATFKANKQAAINELASLASPARPAAKTIATPTKAAPAKLASR